jgi:hypothetical protein
MYVLHYVWDAVHVLQDHPDKCDPYLNVVCVGNLGTPYGSVAKHAFHGACVGLLQFHPLMLPQHERIVSVRLCLLVLTAGPQAVRIGVYKNIAPFNARTVTYRTRPEAEPYPIAMLQVTPEDQSRCVTCDLTPVFMGQTGSLPWFGLSLIPLGNTLGAAEFCAQKEVCLPFLEITTAQQEIPSPPDTGGDVMLDNVFRERVFELRGCEDTLCTPSLYTADIKTITFFARNEGEQPLNLRLQISPDDSDYLDDPQEIRLTPGEMKAVTPYLFGKFMRACVRSDQSGEYIAARVWCQAQTSHYMVKECRQALSIPQGGNSFTMSSPGNK